MAFIKSLAGQESRSRQGGENGTASGGCAALDVDFPATSCVSGTISRTDGQPPTDVSLCLGYSGLLCVEPDQDGLYCIRAPIEGEAVIRVKDPVTGTEHTENVATGEAGTCAEGNCTEANFELLGVSCVTGTVSRDDGTEPTHRHRRWGKLQRRGVHHTGLHI